MINFKEISYYGNEQWLIVKLLSCMLFSPNVPQDLLLCARGLTRPLNSIETLLCTSLHSVSTLTLGMLVRLSLEENHRSICLMTSITIDAHLHGVTSNTQGEDSIPTPELLIFSGLILFLFRLTDYII